MNKKCINIYLELLCNHDDNGPGIQLEYIWNLVSQMAGSAERCPPPMQCCSIRIYSNLQAGLKDQDPLYSLE